MSILTNMQQFMTWLSIISGKRLLSVLAILLAASALFQCAKLDQDIELKQIKDVVVDASTDPVLKANAIFFNPNKVRGKIKKIKVDIYVNGKKAANVDQDLKLHVPSQSEFTVPIEVKLAIKELGFMDTVLGLIGGKKFEVRYEGFLKINYHGIPIKVPVDYKDEVRIKF
jgi:LEA14-like dessication related protein